MDSFLKKIIFPILVSLLLLPFSVRCEGDTLTEAAARRANRAALMSAVLPGAGQVMNRKYWKVPVLYAAAGTVAYFICFNDKEYRKYRKAILLRNDGDPLTTDEFPRFTDEDLTVRKDFYRRNRDLSYIFAGALYVLNIIDAYVDSQLLTFDVDDNLSLQPLFLPAADGTGASASLRLTIKLNRTAYETRPDRTRKNGKSH